MGGDNTRNQILDAAGPVFAEKGFDATVREICTTANVNLAAVNYHFGDKQQLYVETVRRAYQLRSTEVPMPSWPTAANPREKLTGYISTLITRLVGLDKAPWPTRLLTREVLQPTTACKDLVEEYFRPQFDSLLEILDEVVPGSTPLHQRQQLAFSIVGQCLFYRFAGGVVTMLVTPADVEERYDVEQLAGHIASFSMAALGLRPLWQTQLDPPMSADSPSQQGPP